MRWKPSATFVFIGPTPNTGLLKGRADLDQWGLVATIEGMDWARRRLDAQPL